MNDHAVELGVVPPERRTQSPLDLFLIFAGANIVATTLITGASLASAFGTREALTLIAVGSVAGAALVAVLVPVGPRLGVPSVIAARAALGARGAGLLALFLYLTNYAWIAINNVIAASACAGWAGGSEQAWTLGLGLLAPLIVVGGPRLVARADRVAVPLMLALAAAMTWLCLRLPATTTAAPGGGGLSWIRGLDVVIGYQVSWILMFADYSRYTASAVRGAVAVFLALTTTSLWFMTLGLLCARAAGSSDPAAMLSAIGLGGAGALLIVLASLTTNFVNIYLSALAWRSLRPGSGETASIWFVGGVGAALSLLSRAWLERYADFVLVLGAALVPVGGILFGRFFLLRRGVDVAALYAQRTGVSLRGLTAWASGTAVYFLAGRWGGTLPSLIAATVIYVALERAAGGVGRSR